MVSSSLGTSAATAVFSSLFFPAAPSGNGHRRLQPCGSRTACDSFGLHLLLPGGTVTGGELLLAAARNDGTEQPPNSGIGNGRTELRHSKVAEHFGGHLFSATLFRSANGGSNSSEDDDIDGSPVLIFFYSAASFSQRALSNNNDGNSRRAMRRRAATATVDSSLAEAERHATASVSTFFIPAEP
nr:hypothetical protein Iba_chr01aCG16610 [Ipomoea batatas]